MSSDINKPTSLNVSQSIGNKNVPGDENSIASVNARGNANINQSRTIIYNYHYQEHTVTTSTKEDENDNLICPYQGLYHFTWKNAEYFFGREKFVEQLYQYTETRNFIPVLGASGSGKSSVILAGLVPKLIKAGHWQFTHFRPGSDPFLALAQALVPLYAPNLNETQLMGQSRELAKSFQDNTVPLLDVFATIQRNHPQDKVLLIADQFEELYTLCNDEKIRRQFLNILLQTFRTLAEQSSLSTVLVGAMRADFLGNALSYRPVADVLQQGNIMLGAMNSDELRDVIKKPAQKLGVSFEGGLVECILRDVEKEPGNLPLLEFALTELWRKRKGKKLTHDTYKAIGQVSGALTSYADKKFSQLKLEEKEQVRRIFVQLVRPGAGTEDTRRVATKTELNETNWNLVKKLADQRLVVTSRTVITREIIENSEQQSENRQENITQQEEQETVEVVHEALIRNWGQLRGWMETDREFRVWQDRLRESKRQWEEMNRDKGLLLRGAALVQAEERLKERRDELSEGEQKFIRLSQQQQQQEERQKQRQRQRIFGGLVGFSIIVSLLGVWSEFQRRQALTNEQIAEIGALDTRLITGEESLEVQLEVLRLAQQANTTARTKADNVLQKVANLPGHKEINSLEGHENYVYGVAFSPNGELIATASFDNTVKLWKADGTLVKTLKGHQDEVYGVAFSPSGELIASTSWDNTVKLWKADGTLVKTLEGHENYVYGVAFSPSGELIASSSADNTVKLWKADGTLVKTLEGHENYVYGVAFSPSGELIASSSADNTVKLWKADGTLVKTLKGHQDEVWAVAFSPSGELIASSSADNTVKLWKADGTLVKTLEGHENYVYGVAFSPSGELIASSSADNTVKLWKADGTLVKTLEGHESNVMAVAFSPSGELIASTSWDNTVKLWKADSTPVKTLKGHQDGVRGVAFSPSGELIASASWDNTVKLWKPDGTLVKTLEGHQDGVYGVAFSPSGELIASASWDNTVKLWKPDGTLVKTLEGHQDGVRGVAFSPSGELIASASWDNTVKLWKPDGTLVKTLEGHQDGVYGVAFSPSGELIASSSADNTVKLWKADGTLVKTLEGHENYVYGVAFSPSGELIASASFDNTVKLWELDGTLVKTLKGHQDGVWGVVFSPSGELIASASWDKTVKLWKADGTLVKTLEGHQNEILDVAFSPSGELIASASGDNTVKLWNLNRDQILTHACGWMSDYLKNNPNVTEEERRLCEVEASATALFLQGEQLAAEGRIKKAVSKFKQAVELDFNFSSMSAVSLLKHGKQLAKDGQINQAISAYKKAQELDSDLEISARDWHTLCWNGSMNNHAQKVMFACEKAVELDPKDGLVYDSRGLAKALTGDFEGAIEDFEVYVEWISKWIDSTKQEEQRQSWEKFKAQRQGWIESLKTGENPFTEEELEKLR